MATFSSFDAFGRALDAAAKDLDREGNGRIAFEMAREGQKIARKAAAADLGGDPKFSGWAPRLATVVKKSRTGAVLHPTRQSAGPWTVAEQGRNKGSGTGGAFIGPGVNRKTGLTSRTKAGNVRKVRATRGRRWNGYTQGKETASDAVEVMEKELPKIAERESRKVLQRRFDVT